MFDLAVLRTMISGRIFSKTLGFLTLAALAGCAEPRVVVPVATDPDLVSVRIAQATEKASRALDTIAGIEQQRTPVAPMEDYASAPPQLTQLVTLKWAGPLDQVIKTLAAHAGMQVRVKGSTPPVPLVVTVDAYQQPLIELLHDLGLQAGKRADLTVDAPSGVIEIHYASVDTL